jgi:cytochrome c553/cytochrome c5
MIGRWFKTAEKIRDQAGRSRVIRWAIRMATLLAVLGLGGFLVAASGIIPIKASSGHWAITGWFLQFAKERSVATHTLALESPSLDEPWLVVKGAAHYEIGCRPCHGSPELRDPRIARQMTPPPPYLPETVSNWEREELFYIVKHGIKFTGMPAWPSRQRDDEVWAMVAFLRDFPELDAEKYRQLASGEIVPLRGLLGPQNGRERMQNVITTSCGRCHGVDGLGGGTAAFPKLSGQHPTYLAASLQAFASGERHSGIMEPIAAGLSLELMRELADYYGGLKWPPQAPPTKEAALAVVRGEAIAQRGISSQNVPACAACHGPSATPRNPMYPVLAGQYADYLALQLTLFKQEQRGGTAYAHLMRQVAAGLSAEQINDVARYYASLTATVPTPTQ